ncbi:hypothetical protein RIF29_41078 [Crotalaria pallida]|uniref:Uncharacterized protein n=1 Tax=Crotalaria pallida TaxID=3830 RepID=A0AAN9E7A8_CROPI
MKEDEHGHHSTNAFDSHKSSPLEPFACNHCTRSQSHLRSEHLHELQVATTTVVVAVGWRRFVGIVIGVVLSSNETIEVMRFNGPSYIMFVGFTLHSPHFPSLFPLP